MGRWRSNEDPFPGGSGWRRLVCKSSLAASFSRPPVLVDTGRVESWYGHPLHRDVSNPKVGIVYIEISRIIGFIPHRPVYLASHLLLTIRFSLTQSALPNVMKQKLGF